MSSLMVDAFLVYNDHCFCHSHDLQTQPTQEKAQRKHTPDKLMMKAFDF